MADQKCPKCNSRNGFEKVSLSGCEDLEAVQCKSCGAPLTILNTPLLHSIENLLMQLDQIHGQIPNKK
jgi:transcription elongation factor Elf1